MAILHIAAKRIINKQKEGRREGRKKVIATGLSVVYDDTSEGEIVARPFNFHLRKETGQIKKMPG